MSFRGGVGGKGRGRGTIVGERRVFFWTGVFFDVQLLFSVTIKQNLSGFFFCVCVLLFPPVSHLYVAARVVRTAFAVLASSLDRLWWHKLEGIYKWSFVCQGNVPPGIDTSGCNVRHCDSNRGEQMSSLRICPSPPPPRRL